MKNKYKYKALIEEGHNGQKVILFKRFLFFWVETNAGTKWLSASYFEKYNTEREYISHWKKLYGEDLLVIDNRK